MDLRRRFYTIVLYHGWPKLSTGPIVWSRVEWCWLNLYDNVHSQTLWWTTLSQLLALFKFEFKVFTVMCTRYRLWVPFALQKDIGAMAEVQYQFQMCFCWLYRKAYLIAEKRNQLLSTVVAATSHTLQLSHSGTKVIERSSQISRVCLHNTSLLVSLGVF